MEKVQVIPPPKDVDPQILAWKGAAVLGKMESVSELWVTPADWVIFSFVVRNLLMMFTGNFGPARLEGAVLLSVRHLSRMSDTVTPGRLLAKTFLRRIENYLYNSNWVS